MVLKRVVFLLLAFFIIACAAAAPCLASEETVYGPKLLKIGRWRIHLSLHRFELDEPGEGSLVIEKPLYQGKRGDQPKRSRPGL